MGYKMLTVTLKNQSSIEIWIIATQCIKSVQLSKWFCGLIFFLNVYEESVGIGKKIITVQHKIFTRKNVFKRL